MEDFFPSESGSDAPPPHSGSPSPSSNGRRVSRAIPLAARMRPRTLAEYAGQKHILGEGKLLRRAIEADRFSSLIFYGPPGVGKTTLANIVSHETKSRFIALSGVESNVAEIRAVADTAEKLQRLHAQTTVLFVDEIHRFNKAQQDVLLPHLERGTLRFIGATTHNPFFYINSPLVSRSQIFTLEPLTMGDLDWLMHQAIADEARGLGDLPIDFTPEAAKHLATVSDGDARKCLSALELAALTTPPGEDGRILIDLHVAEESVQKKTIVYDGDGDAHYDTISAFIKSIRGSDPDAALYWLAKMLHAGEDIRFIARRLVISASEDIGMADSNGIRVAVAAQHAVEFIGMPEARIPLAHATVYLATAPKSNRAYAAIDAAMKDIQEGRTLPVPKHLRTKTRKKLAAASGATAEEMDYKYSHDSEEGYIPQAYLPEGRRYYEPSSNGMELKVKERLDHWRRLFEESQGGKK